MDVLICPVCSQPLIRGDKAYFCENRHSFDISKGGYVNLLCGAKAGKLTGDNLSMALSRRDFLSRGFYKPLADKLYSLIAQSKASGRLLDVCCGEGYYLTLLSEKLCGFEFYGFDLSKEMIRLAAKRKAAAHFFVANMKNIPVSSDSFDVITHTFAPFCEPEFSRVLKPDGVLFSVASGERHLLSMKKILYETPYLNEEKAPDAPGFAVADKLRLSYTMKLRSHEDIMALLKMTPYFYHTSPDGISALEKCGSLETEADFVIYALKKRRMSDK